MCELQTAQDQGTQLCACCGLKTKPRQCDAQRPTCSACGTLGLDCLYRDGPTENSKIGALKRKHDEVLEANEQLKESQLALQQLFHALRSRPESEANAIFRRIRAGADASSILRHVSTGDLLLQLQVTPETRFRFELPYRREMPSSLQTPANPYLRSLVYEVTLSGENALEPKGASPGPLLENRYSPQYLKPYVVATLVEPKLDAVQPSNWTEVSKDDELMRALLSAYFLSEYQWLPCFHKDDFLDDMKSGSTQHCSSLLANTVLAFACVSLVAVV
jgi:hypothetical protein